MLKDQQLKAQISDLHSRIAACRSNINDMRGHITIAAAMSQPHKLAITTDTCNHHIMLSEVEIARLEKALAKLQPDVAA